MSSTTRKLPPGPKGLPFVGPVVPFMRDPVFFMMDNYRRYGDVVRINMMGLRGAALHGAEANRYILVDAADNFLVAPFIDKVHARWIVGRGLLFIDDPEHRKQRRLIMPAFNRKRIEGYQQTMAEATAQMLDQWVPGSEFDVSKEMHNLARTIVGRTLFSKDLAGTSQELGNAVAAVIHAVSGPLNVGFAQLPFDVPGLGMGRTVRRSLALLDKVLFEIIAQHERGGEDTGDVVSMLVAARDEEGGSLTTQQIRDHLLTLFVAGHETSANALSWAFYLLSEHPTIAEKLLDELDSNLGGQPPAYADIERLPYLDQVVKEVLRLYPPVPSANRIARQAFEWRGYTINAGELVTYVPYVSHHMPDQFPEPEVFRPERFDPEKGDAIPPYAYIPFATGPRSCVGAPFAWMEIKTVLAMTLQRFRLDVLPDRPVEPVVRTTLQPRHGIWVSVGKR